MYIGSNISPLVDMYGDGATIWHNGQLQVETDGITITGGGETIISGGLVTGTTVADGAALSIQVSLVTGYTGDMINMTVHMPPDPSYDIWRAVNADGSMGRWSGNGRLFIDVGGLEVVEGGARVGAGQLIVESGATVKAGGLVIEAGGVTISGSGFAVADGGGVLGTFSQLRSVLRASIMANYLGDMLRIGTTSPASPSFDVMRFTTSTNLMLQLRGDGSVFWKAIGQGVAGVDWAFLRSLMNTYFQWRVSDGTVIKCKTHRPR
jgi:hypothetical protein